MSLNPSNRISEQITGRQPFRNVAGMGKSDPEGVDAILTAELEAAGIDVACRPETLREDGGEPKSIVLGELCGWGFYRAWYYWIAKGRRGIPPDDATTLHATHGKSVRVEGHCGCPSPLEYCHGFAVGSYHVDNQEGLNALAETIRAVHKRGTEAAKAAGGDDDS